MTKTKTKTKMKTKNLFDKIIQLSQAELESMSITRQGTITMKVKEDCKLPEMEVKGADVTIGDGKVVVTKKRTPQPYAGNVSKVVHRSRSSYGTTLIRVSKNDTVSISLTGTTKSIRDKHDIIAALDLSSNLFALDAFEKETSEVADNVLLQWAKAKKAHDEQEKREVRAWEVREKNDLEKIEN